MKIIVLALFPSVSGKQICFQTVPIPSAYGGSTFKSNTNHASSCPTPRWSSKRFSIFKFHFASAVSLRNQSQLISFCGSAFLLIKVSFWVSASRLIGRPNKPPLASKTEALYGSNGDRDVLACRSTIYRKKRLPRNPHFNIQWNYMHKKIITQHSMLWCYQAFEFHFEKWKCTHGRGNKVFAAVHQSSSVVIALSAPRILTSLVCWPAALASEDQPRRAWAKIINKILEQSRQYRQRTMPMAMWPSGEILNGRNVCTPKRNRRGRQHNSQVAAGYLEWLFNANWVTVVNKTVNGGVNEIGKQMCIWQFGDGFKNPNTISGPGWDE